LLNVPLMPCCHVSLASPAPHPAPHSFPTRRSSDLDVEFGLLFSGFLSASGGRGSGDGGGGRSGSLDVEFLFELLDELGEFDEGRSEEHTSELQSRFDLVCRLLRVQKNIPEVKSTSG